MQGNNLLGADVKEAEAFYRKALELNKKNALANSSLAELLMNRGDASQKAGQFRLRTNLSGKPSNCEFHQAYVKS